MATSTDPWQPEKPTRIYMQSSIIHAQKPIKIYLEAAKDEQRIGNEEIKDIKHKKPYLEALLFFSELHSSSLAIPPSLERPPKLSKTPTLFLPSPSQLPPQVVLSKPPPLPTLWITSNLVAPISLIPGVVRRVNIKKKKTSSGGVYTSFKNLINLPNLHYSSHSRQLEEKNL